MSMIIIGFLHACVRMMMNAYHHMKLILTILICIDVVQKKLAVKKLVEERIIHAVFVTVKMTMIVIV